MLNKNGVMYFMKQSCHLQITCFTRIITNIYHQFISYGQLFGSFIFIPKAID